MPKDSRDGDKITHLGMSECGFLNGGLKDILQGVVKLGGIINCCGINNFFADVKSNPEFLPVPAFLHRLVKDYVFNFYQFEFF